MEAAVYQVALEHKRGTGLDARRVHGGLSQAELCLRCDLGYNKAAWTGSLRDDFWLWTKNINPLVALRGSHKLHPVSRAERMYIFGLQLVLFAYVAIVLTRIDVCDDFLARQDAMKSAMPSLRDDEDVQSALCSKISVHSLHLINTDLYNDFQDSSASEFCCEIHMRLLVRTSRALDPEHHRWWAGTYSVYLPVIGLTAVATLLNVFLSQLWFLLAGCQCCQKSASRNLWEWCGNIILIAFGVAPLTYIVWLLAYYEGRLVDTLYHFVLVKSFSVCGSTVIQSVVFLWLWRAEMDGRRGAEVFFLTVHDMHAFYRQARANAHVHNSSSDLAVGSAAAVRASQRQNMPLLL